MIVVDLQLWPCGDETRKRSLGAIVIANDATGTHSVGHYDVRILNQRGLWKSGRVTGFPRLRLGATDLLLRALVACIGYRSKEAAAEAQRGPDLGDSPAAAELES